MGSASQVQNVEERLLSVKPIGIVFRQTLQQNYEDFKERVPIQRYESIEPYVEKCRTGTQNIFWNLNTGGREI